jgi:predicted amidophosphoribosyltransferase
VVPVPLFVWRRLRRGFNQAADLAAASRSARRARGLAYPANGVANGLTATGRQRNVRGAFHLSPVLPRETRTRFIADQVVVLVR